jgi:hypothetical protein
MYKKKDGRMSNNFFHLKCIRRMRFSAIAPERNIRNNNGYGKLPMNDGVIRSQQVPTIPNGAENVDGKIYFIHPIMSDSVDCVIPQLLIYLTNFN